MRGRHNTDRERVRAFAFALAWLLTNAVGPAPAGGQSSQRFPGDPTAGQRLFAERGCIRCHSIWGNGGELGPDLGEVGLGRSLMQLAGMFWNHTPRMIETVQDYGFEWPTLAESELADVISYIYYVKLFDPPGDPDLGARWMSEKRCFDCHSLGGRGRTIGPRLDGYARYIAALPLAEGMWNHGREMRAEQSSRNVPIPQFYGSELTDIQAYIRRASDLRGRDLVLLPPPDPTTGERLFRTKGCTACHGSTGRGTALAPDLRAAIQQLRASEIAAEMWNHSAGITAAIRERGATFPRFSGSELPDILSYLYYLRYEETAGDQTAGQALFGQKGCARCHALDGASSVGPNLAESAAVRSAMSLATAMWNHAPSMYTRVQQAGVPWPLFQESEMRDLAEYLRTLAAQEP